MSDVYCSFGLILLFNFGVQGSSLVFKYECFIVVSLYEVCVYVFRKVQVGDFVVVFGYVLMILGYFCGELYVIQDVFFVVFLDGCGSMCWIKFNQVLVILLLLLMVDKDWIYVDVMISFVYVIVFD